MPPSNLAVAEDASFDDLALDSVRSYPAMPSRSSLGSSSCHSCGRAKNNRQRKQRPVTCATRSLAVQEEADAYAIRTVPLFGAMRPIALPSSDFRCCVRETSIARETGRQKSYALSGRLPASNSSFCTVLPSIATPDGSQDFPGCEFCV